MVNTCTEHVESTGVCGTFTSTEVSKYDVHVIPSCTISMSFGGNGNALPSNVVGKTYENVVVINSLE